MIIDGISDIVSALQKNQSQKSVKFWSPNIQAAYLELYTTFAKIVLGTPTSIIERCSESLILAITQPVFMDNSLEQDTNLTKKHAELANYFTSSNSLSSALGNAIARRAVYTSALREDITSLQTFLRHTAELNIDIALAAVKCVPDAWEHTNSPGHLSDVAQAYLGLIGVSNSPEICSAAISLLAETIDKQSVKVDLNSNSGHLIEDGIRAFDFDVTEFQKSIHERMNTPSLSNAHIRISGAIPLFKELARSLRCQPKQSDRSYLVPWGNLLATAGGVENVGGIRSYLAPLLTRKGLRDTSCSGGGFSNVLRKSIHHELYCKRRTMSLVSVCFI